MNRITCLLFLVVSQRLCRGNEDVPLERARQPLMDPIPMLPPVTQKVFLDITIDSRPIGRIVIGLFGSVAPKLVENFRALCACDMGRGRATGKPLCYRGSLVHRVIPNFMLQAGDFTHHDGTGGETIYGHDIEDESFEVKHNRKFLLSAANKGHRNSNGSQFFITTVKTQWLDNHHVAFGLVMQGENVVKAIEQQGTNGGIPRRTILIVDSGVMEVTDEDRKPLPVARKEL